MTLRCRPGDLAVIIRSYAGNLGKICVVLRSTGHPVYQWEVEFATPIAWASGHVSKVGRARDSCLHPIRDSNGTDEMLLIAGKPTEEVKQ